MNEKRERKKGNEKKKKEITICSRGFVFSRYFDWKYSQEEVEEEEEAEVEK